MLCVQMNTHKHTCHNSAWVLFSAALKAVKILTSEDRRTEIKSREVDIQEEKREERGTGYIKIQKYCENLRR